MPLMRKHTLPRNPKGYWALNTPKRPFVGNSKGIAVLMALSVVLILVSVVLELHISERSNLLNAAASMDLVTLDQMAEAGIHLGMAILVKDRIESESDSLQEDWADPETLSGYLAEVPFENGELSIRIIDELSKIQINSLVSFPEGRQFNEPQRAMWERFSMGLLTLEDMEELEDTDPMTIIYSIKDWLDSGDDDAITGLSGAESDYYESLDPPYACKNGPFDHLSEVGLVQGILPELFFGMGGAAGLSDYLTVYGAEKSGDQGFTYPGRININTADLPVLTAMLPLESAGFAQLLVEYREALSGDLYTNDVTQENWYKNVPGFSAIDIDPALIGISSSIFRIIATAKLNEFESTLSAVVKREQHAESGTWRCKILNLKAQ
jgi:general secretion pathway protein K